MSKLDEITKTKWLREHLAYERGMLAQAYGRLGHVTGVDVNFAIEVFWLHARNLYRFLRPRKEDKSSVTAQDYVPGYKARAVFRQIDRLGAFTFHNGTQRLEWEKVTTAETHRFVLWLNEHWLEWAEQLPQPYAQSVDRQPLTVRRQTGHESFTTTTSSHLTVVFFGSG
ncbi:MAG TPA: hypothetical protein VHW60_22275 [Caulobacteraceae bacterium]|nr:hypothetical protein [Caulobacteraceae bacterium]